MKRTLGNLALLISLASTLAADPPADKNPSTGFKPAQTNLTNIFLQVAASFEEHGSPEPYIRHMQSEHKRISTLFEASTGKAASRMPTHMSDEYLNRFIANWNSLSPKLGLDKLAREAGKCAREAIQGPNGNGTALIHIFNSHQEDVIKTMQNNGQRGTFQNLREDLANELKVSGPSIKPSTIALARLEIALTEAERERFQSFLTKDKFSPSDSDALESFYKGPYDKLSEQGKSEMSKRVWAGTRKEPPAKDTHVSSAQAFFVMKNALFRKIDAALPSDKANTVKAAIDGAFIDTARLAQTELEIGMLEWSVKN